MLLAGLQFFAVSRALAATAHPAGTLVNIAGTIWRISDNGTSRQAIDSIEKFYSNRFSFNTVVPANSADQALSNSGIVPWGDGVLFNNNGTVYQISDGSKHPFVSAEVFFGQGFAFSSVLSGNLSQLSTGTSISTASAAHLPGTLVSSSSGAIWEIHDSGTAQAFPSAAVFYSNGGSFASVVPANSADISSFGALPIIAGYRSGTIVNDSGALWEIAGAAKLGFTSASCYTNFGFTFPMAIAGSTSGIPAGAPICGDNPNADGLTAYYTQNVSVGGKSYAVSVLTADLSTKHITVSTEDASHATCITDCAVQSLATYIAQDGATGGVNGSYFCPVSYGASCTGKTNSFYAKMVDTKSGTLINAANEYGRSFPFIVFASDGTPTWYSQESQYESSGMHAAAGIGYFGLVENGTVSLQTNLLDDKQTNTATTQGAIGLKGQTLYLVHVFGATVPQEANVLQAMGLDDALLLDGGGSTAMIYQGAYKSGPGRDIPNAVMFTEH